MTAFQENRGDGFQPVSGWHGLKAHAPVHSATETIISP